MHTSANMSFLTIPSQEGLLTTIKSGKSREEAQRRSSTGDEDDDNNDDEDDDDEDDPESIRLIPRCSPVPRKRGSSIYDETAEYMRIHLALGAGKRVSFADTTGGDLVDVKEFVAFDSDEEEDSARWKEEEEKYRTQQREPTYHVQPEFSAPAGTDLLQAVRTNKVEVEQMSPVENEPLAFSGIIRVQNVSFHKAVYIRSTMDSWATYFDHPAEYVPGSHDGDTDQFSFKLSFAPPHVTHGSHIEFVVRYETSEGDFWANNSSKNYVVTLLLSYEEDSPQTDVRMEHVRSILRPPKAFSINDDLDLEDELENQEEAVTSRTQLLRPLPVCPAIIQPEIDIEIAVNPFDPSVPPNRELPSAEDTLLSTHAVSPAEQSPYMSSETTHQADSSFVLCASESVEPNKAQPLPRVHCELGNQTQPMNISPSAPPPPPPPPSPQQEPRSDSSRLHGEEVPPSEASRLHLPTTETNVCPTGEDRSTESRPPLELAAPSVAQCTEGEFELGLNELVEGLSEASTRSAAHCAESAPAVLSPVADSQASLGAEGEAPSSPVLTESASASAGASETSLNLVLQSDSDCRGREEEDVPKISPDTLLENPSNTPSEAPELQSEHGGDATLMPSIIFLSGVVSLSIVMQEPSALFFIGLLLVLHHL